MANKLQILFGALKDKATLTTASTATDIAVLRATPHHPSASPPSDRHLAALLSFGRSSRLHAAALVRSLVNRLSSAGDPSVVLKSLLCLHHLLSRGSFIIVDTLASSLLPSSGRRCPLNLSSFRAQNSLALSSWVRWYARLIELLLSTKSFDNSLDRLTSLLNIHLIAELDSLISIVEEISKQPDKLENNLLILEVIKLVEEERAKAQQGVFVRIEEVKERAAELEFGDAVELSCVFRRFGECRLNWSDFVGREVREVKERVERREEEERERGRVRRRERESESARIVGDRVVVGLVEFGSTRWIKSLDSTR